MIIDIGLDEFNIEEIEKAIKRSHGKLLKKVVRELVNSAVKDYRTSRIYERVNAEVAAASQDII